MRAWLIDVYRANDKLVLWLKTPDEDIRIEKSFTARIYADDDEFLKKKRIKHRATFRKTYHGKKRQVYEIEINRLNSFESFVSLIERGTRHRIALYDADVKPEQMYLFRYGLVPFGMVEFDGENIMPVKDDHIPVLTTAFIEFNGNYKINNKIFKDQKKFAMEFKRIDPDVIIARQAFRLIPELDKVCQFHRWDKTPIKYRGGKTFFSYGRTTYRDYAVRLHGRFLIDATSAIGNECEIDAIIELAQMAGTFFQQVASRSFGAVFQQALVRKMYEHQYLIPYKEKPIEPAISMHDLVKADRVGHTFDPVPGFHKDVAEIDFSSMYPWVMFNRNISAETILSDEEPFEQVPGLPFRITLAKKGLVPQAIKAILDRRMKYKRNPTKVNRARAAGLKWVLVSSYGYCRFREFKLGIASTHMAIGAFSREIILQAAKLAEEKGFEIVHGIIDSLYIKKKGITEKEVKDFCEEIEQLTGIPIDFDGIFKWVVYLPSINDERRPLPARYFGVFQHGDIKARGIEVRQRSAPAVIRNFQQSVIEILSKHSTKKEIINSFPKARDLLKNYVENLPSLTAPDLAPTIVISKTEYKHNIPQKIAVEAMKKKGIEVLAGQKIRYVFSSKGVVLLEDYNGRPDIQYYQKLLERALFVVFQPFGFKRDVFDDRLKNERQTIITEFRPRVRHKYIYVRKMPENKRGYSEKVVRRRLEKEGWTVWRGGFLNATRFDELYSNVEKKYELFESLIEKHYPGMKDQLQYMCSVHHGMPDFFCYRKGEFRFVEAKLCHEQLLPMQKTCIGELQKMGFTVEVHKVVDHRTKLRTAEVDIRSGEKKVIEKQLILTKKLAAKKIV